MSAVHGFGAELELVVSAPQKRGRGLGERASDRGGEGFPSGCDWHSCIQGLGGRGVSAVRQNACPLLPPFLPHSVFALLTLAVFVHSIVFINAFIYTLHRPRSM